MAKYIMALDAGTTSNRCILFNRREMCSVSQRGIPPILPAKPGWVNTMQMRSGRHEAA